MSRLTSLLILCIALHLTSAANQVLLTCGGQSERVEVGPQGRPGKIGPIGKVGPKGTRGEKGEPGESGTARSEIETLQARISALEKEEHLRQATNCQDLLNLGQTQSGLYQVFVKDLAETIPVYCDQTIDGGGWLVTQRRTDGSEDFYRNWEDYRRGFGNKSNEFWLGLDLIHAITNARSYELRIDMEDFSNGTAYAKYSIFRVGPLSDNYRLEVGGYSGNAGDSLAPQNGYQFTTKDQDHDTHKRENCAKFFHGAWWYYACHNSNLNGEYLSRQTSAQGVSWYSWKKSHVSLKAVDMKIRPL